MSSSETLYWHDYETLGANPRRDRPIQFAGLRTDLELNPVGKPLCLYAQPPRDCLPSAEACLVTGITPQAAEARGVREAEFITAILAELARPGTCALGYNSLRFDDEVTRFTLYRNLHDPYAREYGEGRSRWDLIDALRTAYALRPEGMEWPRREDGHPSFRLGDLTDANGIEHGSAHDALGDVEATLALARLLRERKPKLFAWLFQQRGKEAVRELLQQEAPGPLLHVSGRFGAARAHLGLVLPLAWHPSNSNELICADLSVDARRIIDLPPAELRRLLYTREADLGPQEQRPGLKSVHINRCPVLLPARMLDDAAAERASLDRSGCEANYELLDAHRRQHPDVLRDKLRSMVGDDKRGDSPDVDEALYSGGFLSKADRQQLDRLRELDPEALAAATPHFEDRRLEELLFRYRARNFLSTLSGDERERWEAFRLARLEGEEGQGPGLEAYHADLDRRLASAGLAQRDREILESLQSWGDALLA